MPLIEIMSVIFITHEIYVNYIKKVHEFISEFFDGITKEI